MADAKVAGIAPEILVELADLLTQRELGWEAPDYKPREAWDAIADGCAPTTATRRTVVACLDGSCWTLPSPRDTPVPDLEKAVEAPRDYVLRKLSDCSTQLRATGQADVAHVLDRIATVARALPHLSAGVTVEEIANRLALQFYTRRGTPNAFGDAEDFWPEFLPDARSLVALLLPRGGGAAERMRAACAEFNDEIARLRTVLRVNIIRLARCQVEMHLRTMHLFSDTASSILPRGRISGIGLLVGCVIENGEKTLTVVPLIIGTGGQHLQADILPA